MKKAGIITVGVVVLLFAVGAYAMGELTTSGTWRYKMTVVVETPEGLKSGSAVREMSNSRSKIELDLPQATHPAKITGEAVVVDLGERGILFALLNGYRYGPDHAKTILFDVFPSGQGGNSAEGIKYYSNLRDAKAVLEAPDYPVLVMFRNINDPKSVEPVMRIRGGSGYVRREEYKIKEDCFEELFGKGVRLKEITIEMTDEPVTWVVKNKLSWIDDYYESQFDGQRFNTIRSEYPFANSLSSGAFSTGDN